MFICMIKGDEFCPDLRIMPEGSTGVCVCACVCVCFLCVNTSGVRDVFELWRYCFQFKRFLFFFLSFNKKKKNQNMPVILYFHRFKLSFRVGYFLLTLPLLFVPDEVEAHVVSLLSTVPSWRSRAAGFPSLTPARHAAIH